MRTHFAPDPRCAGSASTTRAWGTSKDRCTSTAYRLASATSTAPTVSVAATDAAASEPGSNTGSFTVTRAGSTAGALAVGYSDSAPETSETVTITLAPGAGYTVGAPSAATVAIADDDSAPPGETDGDGISDGVEVAAGFNPLVADQDGSGLPDGQDDRDGDGTISQSDSTPGSPPVASSSGGDGGACGATGLEALLLAALGDRRDPVR